MVKHGNGSRSIEGTGTVGRIYVVGPFWITRIEEVVVENEVIERYERINSMKAKTKSKAPTKKPGKGKPC